MGIKYLLGICECKGCKRRGVFEAEVTGTSKKGKPLKIKHWLCAEHTKEILQKGKLASVTYEKTEYFD